MLPSELEPFIEQALHIHRTVPVAAPYFEYYGYASLLSERDGAQCDLEKLSAAGIRTFGIAVANGSAGGFAVGPEESWPAGDDQWAYQRLVRNFTRCMSDIRACPRVRIIADASQLPPDDQNLIGLIPLVTCSNWMVSHDAIDTLFKMGLRISHCAGVWNRSYGDTKSLVLSDFGRDVVQHFNQIGVVIDVAHMSDESTDAIVELSTKPVVDGHTGSRTVIPHCRGHRDATFRKIADKGGVAGIHFADHLFTPKVWHVKYPVDRKTQYTPLWDYNRWLFTAVADPDQRMDLRKNKEWQNRFFQEHNIVPPVTPPSATQRIATVADMADHIEHMINIMGVDHVGLGGDVNGITADSWPIGMDHVGHIPYLTAELLRRRHSEENLRKFLSDNWRRVWEQCLPGQ